MWILNKKIQTTSGGYIKDEDLDSGSLDAMINALREIKVKHHPNDTIVFESKLELKVKTENEIVHYKIEM